MLKTATNIIISCLLLVSTTGLAVSKHYCGSELVSLEITKQAEACCNDGTCCETETEFLQLDTDFLVSTLPIDLRSLFSVNLFLNTHSEEFLSFRNNEFSLTPLYPDVPPPRDIQARLALRQVYRL